jgi:hypothetical protein
VREEQSAKCVLIRRVSDGIDFIGYIVRPEYVLVRKRVVNDWRWKMAKETDEKKKIEIFNSYKAHALWANSYWLRQKMGKSLPKLK